MIQQLMERYRAYDEEARQVRKQAAPTDGLFGMGNDPKKHPCHMQFYEDIGKWTGDFLASDPDPKQAFDAARFLITAPEECSSKESYWMMYASQGWCRELVCRLDADDCIRLRELFDALYPKRVRLPVQQELYRSLKKRAGNP